jgi:uncharacterized protein YheU (UPF0270 family)
VTDYIEIPPENMHPDILQAVIEEFITREGTDYGVSEYSLEQKVAQVKTQLHSKRAIIVFDPVTESCTILAKE